MRLYLVYALLAGVGVLQGVSGTCNSAYWLTQPSKHVANGKIQTAYTTKAACQSECDKAYIFATCIAYDFTGTQCFYIAANQYLMPILSTNAATTHTDTRIDCFVNNRKCNFRDVGPYVLGGTAITQNTEDACREACVSNIACRGVSYIVANRQCNMALSDAALSPRTLNIGAKMFHVQDTCQTLTCPSFLDYPDRNADGGLPMGSLTLTACQSRCTTNTQCTGIVMYAGMCWTLQTSNIINNLRSQIGYTFYLINRCTTTPGCGMPTWAEDKDMHVSGGSRQTALTTQAACQQGCINNMACVAVDWRAANTGCWHHMDATKLTSKSAETGTNLYRLNRCPGGTNNQCGTPTWSEEDNMHAFGGIQQVALTSKATCQAECIKNAMCVAADIREPVGTTTFACWFHLKDTNLQNKGVEQGVKLYTLNRCPGMTGCGTPTWTTQTDMHAIGGVKQAFTDQASCESNCITNMMCVAVDLKLTPVPFECWFHLVRDNLNNIQRQTGTNLRTLIRCPLQTTTPKTTVITTTVPACNGQWAETDGQHAIGGQSQPSHTTVVACQRACVANAACVAIDADMRLGQTLCWHHTDVAKITNLLAQSNTKFYRLTSRTCGATCQPMFTPNLNKHVPGGTPMAVHNTEDKCKQACVDDMACTGVDYAGPGSTCWINKNTAIASKLRELMGNTFYLIDRTNCPTTCKPTFQAFKDRNGPKGTRDMTKNTLQLCQDACISNPACSGVDYQGTTSCFLNTDPDIRNGLGTQTGNTFYLINRGNCGGPTTTKPPVTTATTPTTTDRCGSAQWAPVRTNIHAVNGKQNSFTTLAACQDGCVKDPTCAAIDVDKTDGTIKCWFHPTANIASAKLMEDTDFYVLLNRCPGTGVTGQGCTPEWNAARIGVSFGGGSSQASLTTLQACQKGCVDMSSCLAIDVNTGGNPLCWFHANAANIVETRKRNEPGINHYVIKDRCPGQSITTNPVTVCIPEWNPARTGVSFNGAAPQAPLTTLQACQKGCVDMSSCVAIDVNTGASPLCWFHTNAANIVETSKKNTPGINHYVIKDRCPGQNRGVTTGPTTAGTTRNNCQPSYDRTFFNTALDKGQLETGIGSDSQCRLSCAQTNILCIGIQWDTNTNQCFFNLDILDFNSKSFRSGINSAMLVDRCPNAP